MKISKKLLYLCLMVFFIVIHVTVPISASSEELDNERTILPFDQISVVERQTITLNARQSSNILKPGDTVVFEAKISPGVGYSHDTLYIDYTINGYERDILVLKRGGNGVYRGELRITNEHVGYLGFLASIPEIDNKNDSMVINHSNTILLRVSPDMRKISSIRFRGNPLILAKGMESAIEIACDNNKGEIVYVFSNVEGLVFSVQDKSIAVITDGILEAKAAGETTIKASYYGLTATCELKVF